LAKEEPCSTGSITAGLVPCQYLQKEIEILTEFRSLYHEIITNYDNYLSLKEIISDTDVLENSLDLLMARMNK